MTTQFIGHTTTLGFSLTWQEAAADQPMLATRGWLGATVANHEVWPHGAHDSESWPWIELLEFLARHWRYLEHEIGSDPLGLDEPLDCVREVAEARWDDASEAVRDVEEAQLLGYLRSHDLSRALRGALAPKLFVARRSERWARVSAANVSVDVPWQEVSETLVSLGDAIAARLSALTDSRSVSVCLAWAERSKLDVVAQLVIASGRDHEQVSKLMQGAAGEPSAERFAVAARMVSERVSLVDLAPFFDALREETEADRDPLSLLRKRAVAHIGAADVAAMRRYEQGYTLARWYREERKIPETDRIDLDAELTALGVFVRSVSVDQPEVDAMCALHPSGAASIVVNTFGEHAQGALGRRATLAHELCHLLVDLGIVIPFVEAKSVRAPKHTEQRANAFAAELLVPQSEAARVAHELTALNVPETVRALSHRFGASQTLCARQLSYALRRVDVDTSIDDAVAEYIRALEG